MTGWAITWAGRLGDLLRCRRGASALEFALVAVPFLFMIFGAIEIGRLIYFQTSLSSATEAAARLYRIDASTSEDEIKASIVARLLMADPARLSVTVPQTTFQSVNYREIVSTYEFQFMIPTLFATGVTLNGSATAALR